MKFSLVKNPDGSISQDFILYEDESGTQWTVPEGHRYWDMYQDWLAQGNTPNPPN
jgi:hypothetical protein